MQTEKSGLPERPCWLFYLPLLIYARNRAGGDIWKFSDFLVAEIEDLSINK